MSAIIEDALKLPREEKIELLHALQEDLQWDDEALEDDDLTEEEWADILRRERMLESGEMKWITTEEFTQWLNDRRNALQA